MLLIRTEQMKAMDQRSAEMLTARLAGDMRSFFANDKDAQIDVAALDEAGLQDLARNFVRIADGYGIVAAPEVYGLAAIGMLWGVSEITSPHAHAVMQREDLNVEDRLDLLCDVVSVCDSTD